MPPTTSKPPRRFSSIQILVGVIVSAVLLGFVGGFARARFGATEAGDGLFALTALAGLVIGCIATIPYWNRLDEAAREAHKDAWLWGGMAGYILAAVYAVLLVVFGQDAAIIDLGGYERAELVAVGVAVTVLVQAACYIVAWVLWWVRRS